MEIFKLTSEIIGYIDAKENFHQSNTSKIIPLKITNPTSDFNIIKDGEKPMTYDGVKLIKRSENRWEYKKRINGERISFYGKTQKECIEKYKTFKNRLKSQRIEKHYTFYNALDEYCNNLTGYALKTYPAIIRLHIKPNIKDIALNKINEELILKLLEKIESGRNKIKAYTVLTSIFNKAIKNKLIKTNPLDFIERPKYKQKKGTALSIQEETLLLKKAKESNDIYIILKFLLCSGCRRTEAFNVKWNDIDYNNNTMHIKGTKTNESNRYIPLFPNLKILLNSINKTNDFILPRMQDINKPYRFIKKVLPNHKLHDLRHTFATKALEKGVPMKILQTWLGHSNYNTTADIYTHVTDKASQDYAILLDDHFDDHLNKK